MKSFFDRISKEFDKVNIFIIYYGCNPDKFKDLSTFRWPILAMEDISIHQELEVINIERKAKDKDTKKGKRVTISQINQLSILKVNEMKNKLNKMDEDFDDLLYNNFFKNLFDIIIYYTEKTVMDKIERKSNDKNDYSSPIPLFSIIDNYDSSYFKTRSNFYLNIKEKYELDGDLNYFNINIDYEDYRTSTKSQIISKVYKELNDKLRRFFIFSFGSVKISKKPGKTNIDDYLMKCQYLNLPLSSFLKDFEMDVYFYLFNDYCDFLISNSAAFNEDMKKRKTISDRILTAISRANEVQETFDFLFSHFYKDEFKFIDSNQFYEANKLHLSEKDQSLVFLQTYVDYFRFRSFAGLNLRNHQSYEAYWDRYLNFCIFPFKCVSDESDERSSDDKKDDDPTILIEKIKEFRRTSIFDIFSSPINYNEEEKSIETDLLMKMISLNDFELDFETNSDEYKAYKYMNFISEPMFGKNRSDRIDKLIVSNKLTNANKAMILSMMMIPALEKWKNDDLNDLVEIFNKFESIKSIGGIDKKDLKYVRCSSIGVKGHEISLPKFGKLWKGKYEKFDYNIKGESFKDEIQSIVVKGFYSNPDLSKWINSAFKHEEPLAIVSLRKYWNSQSNHNRKQLAKVLDPYFGDERIVDLFFKYINDKITDENVFPLSDITSSDVGHIMENMTFKCIAKFWPKEKNDFYKIEVDNPSLSHVVWFHITYNNPTKYPLLTLLIKESQFFVDFKVVPKLISSILHLRHLFSYNPVFLPIILHCTSLFTNSECKVNLYSLGYFDMPNKEFANMQKEVDEIGEFLRKSYPKYSEKVLKSSSYEQIRFILKIYINKYNKIIEQINKALPDSYFDDNSNTIEVSSILPNMLLNNVTLKDIVLPILYNETIDRYKYIEEYLRNIFSNSCMKPFNSEGNKNSCAIQLLTIKNEGEKKDFIGFSREEYESMFRNYMKKKKDLITSVSVEKSDTENYHVSVLAFLLYLYHNEAGDDYTKYTDLKEKLNDISNCYLNSYPPSKKNEESVYSLKVNSRLIKFNKSIEFEPSKFYPMQSIFTYLPNELKDEIKKLESKNAEIKIIRSDKELKKLDESIDLKFEGVEEDVDDEHEADYEIEEEEEEKD